MIDVAIIKFIVLLPNDCTVSEQKWTDLALRIRNVFVWRNDNYRFQPQPKCFESPFFQRTYQMIEKGASAFP
jgi:hypothetical protein